MEHIYDVAYCINSKSVMTRNIYAHLFEATAAFLGKFTHYCIWNNQTVTEAATAAATSAAEAPAADIILVIENNPVHRMLLIQ